MLTLLSFGGGQDSTDILYRIATDHEFRNQYVQGKLLVVMADTGDEHDSTYEHVKFIKTFCQIHEIEFHFLTPDQGYHPVTWPDLITWMKNHDGIQSKMFPKSCTDNLKIKPIYNFLDNWIGKTYFGIDLPPNVSRKRFIKRYAYFYGKINVLLGIAKGEESRIGNTYPQKWMEQALHRIYPLVEIGVDRQECQNNINKLQLPLPAPSNCKRCPFLSEIELVWLYRFYPKDYNEWVTLEQNKINKWKEVLPAEKNLGVNGTRLLPEVLDTALAKYGHWSDNQLHDYKMSHGHCVKSKY